MYIGVMLLPLMLDYECMTTSAITRLSPATQLPVQHNIDRRK